MSQPYPIENTTLADLELIYDLFDQSVRYQEKNGYPSWRAYDKNAIVRDIEQNNQYKLLIDAQPAIVFSVCYADKIIWREMEKGDAVYLHRIVSNPAYKGLKLFGAVLKWAREHVERKRLAFIRMDTWASNTNLIDYYKDFGFSFIGDYTTPDSPELPTHNRNLPLALLELRVH